MTDHLHHKLAVLKQNLLHGKLPRAIDWDDAVSLVSHLGRTESHVGEEVTFVIGGERALFTRPHSGELNMDEVSRLRKLLKAAESAGVADSAVNPGRMVVVV